jgi:hypothetical protein
MKKMKTTIAATVALTACVGSQALAQVKQDVITFALSGQQQLSVSTSGSANNAGYFTDQPKFYKTSTIKVTEQSIIQYIGFVRYGAAKHYGTAPKLTLVQGELSGFFNVTPDLGSSVADYNTSTDGDYLNGYFSTADGDVNTTLANSQDSTFVALSDGRHVATQPDNDKLFPPGHMQPWGQIYVQWTTSQGLACDNVTPYFALAVQECYDCFYLNSFVSDATFTVKTGAQAGPPCCSVGSTLVGKGKDRYYLTFSFDNTINNPYLDPSSSCWAGDYGYGYSKASTIPMDGIDPDTITYSDLILSHIGKNEPYVARFTLNGIVTYTWQLKYLNTTDISPDFLGTATYAVSGYGFIGLYCNLFTGTGSFKETLVKAGACCSGEDWYYYNWYGIGAEYVQAENEAGYETKYVAGGYDTPVNVSTSLTYHENFNRAGYEVNSGNFAPAAWPTPAFLAQPWDGYAD